MSVKWNTRVLVLPTPFFVAFRKRLKEGPLRKKNQRGGRSPQVPPGLEKIFIYFGKESKGGPLPAGPPFVTPMGSGAVPQDPQNNVYINGMISKTPSFFECASAMRSISYHRRGRRPRRPVNVIHRAPPLSKKQTASPTQRRKMPPRRHHERKVRSNASLFD